MFVPDFIFRCPPKTTLCLGLLSRRYYFTKWLNLHFYTHFFCKVNNFVLLFRIQTVRKNDILTCLIGSKILSSLKLFWNEKYIYICYLSVLSNKCLSVWHVFQTYCLLTLNITYKFICILIWSNIHAKFESYIPLAYQNIIMDNAASIKSYPLAFNKWCCCKCNRYICHQLIGNMNA